jgi:hypothetical protein
MGHDAHADLQIERNFIGAQPVSLKRASSPDPRNHTQGTVMNFTRTLGSLFLLTAFGTHANAQLTREAVYANKPQAPTATAAAASAAGYAR